LKGILASRHVGTISACPICQQDPEDILHLLFQCPTAADLWGTFGLQNFIDAFISANQSGSVVLEQILKSNSNVIPGLDLGLKEVVSTVAWYLWWIRRRRTHNEDVPPMRRCNMSILAIVANYAKAAFQSREAPSSKWERPQPRQVKVNVGGSFYADSYTGAVGAVLRDYQGQLIAASCKFLPQVSSAAMAEALAMKEGLSLVVSKGCSQVIAEADSLETIQACTGQETWWTEPAAIFADCVDLASLIDGINFRHCPREVNRVAHVLARESFRNKITCTWDDDPPSFLLSSLIDDVTEL
jgi:ribonuclease HI